MTELTSTKERLSDWLGLIVKYKIGTDLDKEEHPNFYNSVDYLIVFNDNAIPFDINNFYAGPKVNFIFLIEPSYADGSGLHNTFYKIEVIYCLRRIISEVAQGVSSFVADDEFAGEYPYASCIPRNYLFNETELRKFISLLGYNAALSSMEKMKQLSQELMQIVAYCSKGVLKLPGAFHSS